MPTPISIRLPVLLLSLALVAACKGGGDGDSDGETDTQGSGDCPGDMAYFTDSVWTPIVSQQCIACHTAAGPAKDSRLVLLTADDEGYLEHNFNELREVALIDEGDGSLLLQKPTAQHPAGHTGGEVVPVGSDAYKALEQFVARSQGTFTCDADGEENQAGCDVGGAGVRRLRRLSHSEYNQSLAAILGAPTTRGLDFAADKVVQGFGNNADALTVSGLLAEQYREAAEASAAEIVANLASRLGCDPETDGEVECAASFIASFGKQVFRRPLTATERSRYEKLWAEAAAVEGFTGAAQWTIAAMLQSPAFLYRSELGEHVGDGVYQLTTYELASELSYLIVGEPPDAELMAAADDGSLAEPEVLEAQALRLLASASSEATLLRFVDEWLHIDRLAFVPRDGMLFPELTPEIRAAMLGETHRFVSDIYRSGGSWADLMTAKHSFMTAALAEYYSMTPGDAPADPAGFRRVVKAGMGAGLLAHGSVLTTHALPTSSSPIHRGLLVRERLLCQSMPPPPPALNTSPPPVDPNLSTRERYTQHSADATCAGCHDRIDPIGFGFEAYDGIGRHRTADGIHPIDASGEILLTANSDGSFNGIDELAQLLAGSPDAIDCYALQWSRYALGSAAASELACVQDDLATAFAAADGRLDSLVLALVQTKFFRERGGAPASDSGSDSDDTAEPTTAGPTSMGDDTSDSADDTGEDPTADPTADPEAPMTSPGIDAMVMQDSKWDAGECNTVTVTNTTDAAITWQVVLQLQGTIQNAWNGEYTQQDTTYVWVGAPYNAVVDPKTSTSFGFCLNY